MADSSKPLICPACGEYEVARGDFICPVCFRRLPAPTKRKLRLARGRAEEPKKKDEALRWLQRRDRYGS
jgi:hypothetical protein